MANKNDPRRRAGAIVHAKATAVTSLAECSRLYGARAKTKTVTGTVVDIIIDRKIFTLSPSNLVCEHVQLCNVVAGTLEDDIAAGRAPGLPEYEDMERLIGHQAWEQGSPVFTGDCDSVCLNFSQKEPLVVSCTRFRRCVQ